jgi:hypothetical protein
VSKIVAVRPVQLVNLGVTLMTGQEFELPKTLSHVQQKEYERATKAGLIKAAKEVKPTPQLKVETPKEAAPAPEEIIYSVDELNKMMKKDVEKIALEFGIDIKGKFKDDLVKAILKAQKR